MTLKYLLDENVDPVYQTQLLRSNSRLVVLVISEPDAPNKGTLDPEVLCWCEANNFVLLTNNRSSIPIHLTDCIAQNRQFASLQFIIHNS